MENLFKILEWDSQFFGFTVAQILPQTLSKNNLLELLQVLKSKKIRLAYWPSGIISEEGIKETESMGGKLVDVKTTFAIDIEHKTESDFIQFDFIKEYDKNEASNELLELAYESGLYSRFKTDKKIGEQNFKKLYATWIEKSVSKKIALAVLASIHDNKITGMITLGEKNNCGNIGLIAIDKSQQGKGIGHALIQESLLWFLKQRFTKVQVVTQGSNMAARKLYEKNGFTVLSSQPYFHFWL